MLAGLLPASGPSQAEPQVPVETRWHVLLLASDNTPLHQRVLSALESQLRGSDAITARAVADTPEATRLVAAFDCSGCLIVTSGVAALQTTLDTTVDAELLSIAIPKERFEQIGASRGDPPRLSAIYMDVSLADMLQVVDLRLHGVETVGIITADGNHLERERLRGDLPAGTSRFREYRAGGESELVAVFEQAARETDAILALPHPQIYNRDTIVRIMLTTYRIGTPLIGYSEGLNRAGALMSVFATPEMLGEDAGRVIATAVGEGEWRPLRRHTVRYNVVINRQVAHSMRIRFKDGS
ncbi:hypothetical protein B1C78_04305 [Thioalkalivibrio denitrificans]|uniref:ABC transporter substrate-binding protein n=1 Tax=Thioalkalivibrio denitrificans TaxID=108003 RepID=A0A1V3NQB3_9GAMM|nr:hypothetical protein B1C78_04305 [Thioalkalivibrio denitrificans]